MTEPTAPTITSRPRRSRTGTWLIIAALLLLLTQVAHAAPRFMKVRVTFYSPSSRGKTATGRSARLPGLAVDPRVIPLGSRVAVPGFGVRVADDTGGAIKGHRVDVRLPVGSRSLARKHGVKHLRVRIVHPKKHRGEDDISPARKARLARAQRARAAKLARAKAATRARERKVKLLKAAKAKREKVEKRRQIRERREKLAQRKRVLAQRAAKRRQQEARAERRVKAVKAAKATQASKKRSRSAAR